MLLWITLLAFAGFLGYAGQIGLHNLQIVLENKATEWFADFIKKGREAARRFDVPLSFAGHIGDGNFHPVVLTDSRDKEHFNRAHQCVDEIIEIALSLGGVISGEHGIGLDKKRFLKKAMDPVAIEIMRKIKDVLDPANILNPGKIWEESTDES